MNIQAGNVQDPPPAQVQSAIVVALRAESLSSIGIPSIAFFFFADVNYAASKSQAATAVFEFERDGERERGIKIKTASDE